MLLAMQVLYRFPLLVLFCLATGVSSQIATAGEETGIGNTTEADTAANTCFEAASTPGCSDDPLCESIVCTLRPECCDFSYNETCVELALDKCDLPDPLNSCISESRFPGCLDEHGDGACLESVCQKDETCCTVAYGPNCVELAREDSKSCSPKTPTNKCYEESPFGGCDDRRCENLVCTIDKRCCDSQGRIGAWSGLCVTGATALCQPEIQDLESIGGDCPSGMTCSYDSMVNCTELASQYKDRFFLGNILGGVYCGNEDPNRKGITNCPRGSYCPDPETMIPCPAGFYCPYKTQEPVIRCTYCKEGATELVKDRYGWILLGIIIACFAAYIGWGLLTRYNDRLAYQISELEKRVQSHLGRIKNSTYTNTPRNLEKLRPKLELINIRLTKMEKAEVSVKKSTDSKSSGLIVDRNQILFDAKRLFDVLDADASGDLTFDELNEILGLSQIELREFIRRMNEMAGSSPSKVSVKRHVFVKYFLQVLTDTSNLNISFEEAEAVFNELADGNESLNEILLNDLYASSLSEFLSDSQILQLITEFKRIKAESKPEDVADGKRRRSSRIRSSNRRSALGSKSLKNFRMSRRASSATPFEGRESRDKSSKAIFEHFHMSLPGGTTATIERDVFIENYPKLLMDVILTKSKDSDDVGKATDFSGVDLSFKDLSLSINLGKKSIDVVNKVTGRLKGKTMTALMGGSGAGKTSLLNALCGRAYYGETTGTVYLNGHETDIQEHRDCIGFVPQDDIVYPELTVRENFIYAGKFQLPKETTYEEIEELADETIANLGLSRVANSLVGDVKRRGVSGGEKKRVNIGLELMSLPSILFLDEPTSGLDATSALLVMKSLSHLVQKDGVTVVSVIHQPRKFIFDLFDSLILLGVGGKIIYHGPTAGAKPYFNTLRYTLPIGESVADWLIDISSGRLEPDSPSPLMKEKSLTLVESSQTELTQSVANQIESVGEKFTDQQCVGDKGVTTGKVIRAIEDAKSRRAWLCTEWLNYFNKLDKESKSIYEPPEKYDLPIDTIKQSFWKQFIYQVNRALLVAWRNRFSKIVNSAITIGSIISLAALDGFTTIAIDSDPNLPFATLVRPQLSQTQELFDIIAALFSYTYKFQIEYPIKLGVIICILVGLTATSAVTSKRLEFFREAASGYDSNAYFFAINLISIIEHSTNVLIATAFATWIRHPIAAYRSHYIHFLLLTWTTVGWAMFFPMVCSPDNVTMVAGFFFVFCSIGFSGAFRPFSFKEIYTGGGIKEFFAGWFSPPRFFLEAITVGEYRCLPEQSGFTIETNSFFRFANTTVTRQIGYAGHDLNAVRFSCDGWYWSVIPVILIGITVRYAAIGAMHACFRGQQAKKPLIYVCKRNGYAAAITLLYCIGLAAFISVTTWLFVRDQPFEENFTLITQAQLAEEYGFFD